MANQTVRQSSRTHTMHRACALPESHQTHARPLCYLTSSNPLNTTGPAVAYPRTPTGSAARCGDSGSAHSRTARPCYAHAHSRYGLGWDKRMRITSTRNLTRSDPTGDAASHDLDTHLPRTQRPETALNVGLRQFICSHIYVLIGFSKNFFRRSTFMNLTYTASTFIFEIHTFFCAFTRLVGGHV